MLDNFHLAAIIKRENRFSLLQIPLHRPLQDQLAASWESQFNAFANGIREIRFNAGYHPEEDEQFCFPDYDLPPWLAQQHSQTVSHLDVISQNHDLLEAIKGIIAFARNRDEEVMLFQNFSRSHVIRPGRFLLLQNNTYETNTQAGLTLDDKLCAVYLPRERKLLFHSFRIVNSFLPLADFYEEASVEQIREVLAHPLLHPENADTLAVGASQWMRKRFAMLRDSGVLDEYSANQIEERSRGYEVDIQIRDDRLVFPAERTAARKLLQFLNEEIYRGAITETLYETNSKREADT